KPVAQEKYTRKGQARKPYLAQWCLDLPSDPRHNPVSGRDGVSSPVALRDPFYARPIAACGVEVERTYAAVRPDWLAPNSPIKLPCHLQARVFTFKVEAQQRSAAEYEQPFRERRRRHRPRKAARLGLTSPRPRCF
ncbi:MAG: hypothetical protein NZM42_11550, partial [Gemmatales bacterium]|nr:hypothetical protein [Gemmatales bacterium]